MNAQCPILVADDPTTAEHIRTVLSEESGKQIGVLTYEEFSDAVAWQRNGIVLFVVSGAADISTATSIVQEARIRCSPVSLGVIETGIPSELVECLEPHISCRIHWPDQMNQVLELIRSIPGASTKKKSLADTIAERLMVHTPSLVPQASRLAMAATHDVTVLLTGETGTGKTYLARLLHDNSPRRDHPFLMVPCGAQQSNLFESTFFGHVKGAYTGAHQTRVGRFAAAGRGTILLDEIDALGLEQQASLLRVIETGEYELVGGNETLRSEARIIVASNADLAEEVEKGNFRQDLYYRLNVISFHLPPLRRRRQDIPLLARGIVARSNTKFKKNLFSISSDVLDVLAAYDWRGNIRQLENVLQEAVLISSGPELTRADLPVLPVAEVNPDVGFEAAEPVRNGAPAAFVQNGNGELHAGLPMDTLVAGRFNYERGIIQKTLAGCKYNRSRAARVLGVSRVTLYKKMKQYGLTDLPPR